MQLLGQVAPPCARKRTWPDVAMRHAHLAQQRSPPVRSSPTVAPSDDICVSTTADMATDGRFRLLAASNTGHRASQSAQGCRTRLLGSSATPHIHSASFSPTASPPVPSKPAQPLRLPKHPQRPCFAQPTPTPARAVPVYTLLDLYRITATTTALLRDRSDDPWLRHTCASPRQTHPGPRARITAIRRARCACRVADGVVYKPVASPAALPRRPQRHAGSRSTAQPPEHAPTPRIGSRSPSTLRSGLRATWGRTLQGAAGVEYRCKHTRCADELHNTHRLDIRDWRGATRGRSCAMSWSRCTSRTREAIERADLPLQVPRCRLLLAYMHRRGRLPNPANKHRRRTPPLPLPLPPGSRPPAPTARVAAWPQTPRPRRARAAASASSRPAHPARTRGPCPPGDPPAWGSEQGRGSS